MFIGLNKTLTILVNISLLSNNIKPYIISKIELKIKKKLMNKTDIHSIVVESNTHDPEV